MQRIKSLSFLLLFLLAQGSRLHAQQAPFISWSYYFGGSVSSQTVYLTGANSMIESKGIYVIAGGTSSADGDVTGNHGGTKTEVEDAWVIGMDSTGLLWQHCLGGGGDEDAQGIVATI